MILSEHSRPGLAILLILAAGLLLSSQDALAKTLTLSYPLLLVVCLRYLAQSLLMLLVFASLLLLVPLLPLPRYRLQDCHQTALALLVFYQPKPTVAKNN